jgi:tetratricopeptide (TPR) repeat protein
VRTETHRIAGELAVDLPCRIRVANEIDAELVPDFADTHFLTVQIEIFCRSDHALEMHEEVPGKGSRLEDHLVLPGKGYERRDVLTIQSDVARAIANEVRLKLTPIEQQRLTARHPVNPEALDEYLKGRSFWGQRTEPNLRKAIAHFQAAIGKDPNYAAAYSGLADTYSILGVYTYISPSEAFPTAKAAAIRALQLDDELAEAHVSMGIVMERLDWDWSGVDRHQRRALELDPGYATSHHWRSYHLEVVGRFDESIQEMALAWRLDPFSLPINTSYGAAFL